MRTKGQRITDLVEQESRYPVIDSTLCVHAQLCQAECSACVEACPNEAWVLDEHALGLDTEACDGCGLCMPVCPPGALHIHLPWIIRSLGGQTIALIACEKTNLSEIGADLIPCVHALGIRQLLALYHAGIKYLLIATPDCKTCPRNPDEGLLQRVEKLNKLLHNRNRRPMKILQRSFKTWSRLFKTDEVISRGTHLSRRNFLRGGRNQLRRQLVISDPLNLPEFRTVPPGQLLPDENSQSLLWPWVPCLEPQRCDGCDACMKLCPTQAIKISKEEDGKGAVYELSPTECSGCNLCTDVCVTGAITVRDYARSGETVIKLVESHCPACGNSFHHPRPNLQSGSFLCPACRSSNHNRNLYQVLTEHA